MSKRLYRYEGSRRIRRKAVLYRHFAADGELLYVGLSVHPMQRLAQHAHTAKWFKDTVRIELEHLNDDVDALQAEGDAIFKEQPTYNVLFKGRPRLQKVVAKETARKREEETKSEQH